MKTNPVGPAQTIRLTRSRDTNLCPVTALQEYVAIRPHSQPLFCHFDGSPLTRYQFSAVLRKILSFRGLHEYKYRYRAHSFCIGAATAAFELGVPAVDIQRMGCWRSDAFFSYIRPAPT